MLGLIEKYPAVSIYSSQYAVYKNGVVCPSKKILSDNIGKDSCFDFIRLGVTLKYVPINSSNVIFRKSILQKSGIFDERISFYEDYDLFLRIGVFSELAYLEMGPLCFYCQDIDVSKRANGKLPPFNKHLIWYLEKFEPFYSKNTYLKRFIEQFVLNNLYLFRNNNYYSAKNKQLLKTISIRRYSFKHLVKYYAPNFIVNIMCKSLPES